MDGLKKMWKQTVEEIKGLWGRITGKSQGKKPAVELITTVSKAYEINLVPAVKAQMIRAQKIRNLVLFICIVVSAASAGVVLVLFSIKSGQDIAMANQDGKLSTLSAKLLDYDELEDLVTIQGQLEGIEGIAENKTVLSRVFGALGVMLPTGGDVVQFSQLRVDMNNDTVRLEGQTDARVAPLIDYRVLESFKKGAALTKYDYGRYVDTNGTEIPTWCISEADEAGVAYKSGENYFAWWDLSKTGCAGAKEGATLEEDSEIELFYNKNADVEMVEQEIAFGDLTQYDVLFSVDAEGNSTPTEPSLLRANIVKQTGEDGVTRYIQQTVTRVKIWRTPQFTTWYNGGYMDLSGGISGMEHFESECTSYSGLSQDGEVKWSSTNNCMLAPEGLTITSSANGRDESDNLVLKFSASMLVNDEFFTFRNKHMMAIGPMGQNVTDSYVQIGGMFAQEATECAPDDPECFNNTSNLGGN